MDGQDALRIGQRQTPLPFDPVHNSEFAFPGASCFTGAVMRRAGSRFRAVAKRRKPIQFPMADIFGTADKVK
jgi:hypothetical protein